MASQPPDQEQQQNVIVHVREDSKDMMDQMFAVINQKSQQPLTIPYKMRY